ncbi:type II secretion system protein [Psychrobacillus sp. FSL K6-4046]|uniref:type II secretion system protein n=1 Tax=unclassified Psychrobacillus TaxID=2636677 RepID=UPI0020415978|nr:type II secretion system protein [Psychrobacillus sp. MER TA 171]MCM3357818.1 type II secretion system GspH family protein [Psychrobacillus sp. MER TA 171]
MDINQHVSNEMTNKGDSSMKKMKHLLKNQKGLTLVELLAVIVILAIVSAIAVPAIGGIIENSRYSAVKADATNVLNAAKMYFIDNPEEKVTDGGTKTGTLTVDVATLKKENYLESSGKIETGTVTKGSPNTISAGPITFSGSKSITFTDATLDDINKDTQKGSGDIKPIVGTKK